MSNYRIEPPPKYKIGDFVKISASEPFVRLIKKIHFNDQGLIYYIGADWYTEDKIMCVMVEAPEFTEKDKEYV